MPLNKYRVNFGTHSVPNPNKKDATDDAHVRAKAGDVIVLDSERAVQFTKKLLGADPKLTLIGPASVSDGQEVIQSPPPTPTPEVQTQTQEPNPSQAAQPPAPALSLSTPPKPSAPTNPPSSPVLKAAPGSVAANTQPTSPPT
jgi:hypothetical protein